MIDVNGIELEIGQTVCFHSSSSRLQIGKIIKIGKSQYHDKPGVSDFRRELYVNVWVQPNQDPKGRHTRIQNIRVRDNILVLQDLFSTYL
jgi:hypothetical protein